MTSVTERSRKHVSIHNSPHTTPSRPESACIAKIVLSVGGQLEDEREQLVTKTADRSASVGNTVLVESRVGHDSTPCEDTCRRRSREAHNFTSRSKSIQVAWQFPLVVWSVKSQVRQSCQELKKEGIGGHSCCCLSRQVVVNEAH